jgi:hypothetical protein
VWHPLGGRSRRGGRWEQQQVRGGQQARFRHITGGLVGCQDFKDISCAIEAVLSTAAASHSTPVLAVVTYLDCPSGHIWAHQLNPSQMGQVRGPYCGTYVLLLLLLLLLLQGWSWRQEEEGQAQLEASPTECHGASSWGAVRLGCGARHKVGVGGRGGGLLLRGWMVEGCDIGL